MRVSLIPADLTSLDDESFSKSVSDSIAMQLAHLLGETRAMWLWKALTVELLDDVNFNLRDPTVTGHLEKRLGPNV